MCIPRLLTTVTSNLNFRHTQTLIKTLRRTQQISTSNRTQQISTNKTEIAARENTWYIVGHGRHDEQNSKNGYKRTSSKSFYIVPSPKRKCFTATEA